MAWEWIIPGSRAGRTRRTLLRREGEEPSPLGRALASPNFGWAVLITAAFVGGCSVLAWWARSQPLVAVGRVMTETHLVRVPFETLDRDGTARKREQARARTPRIYRANETELELIRKSIRDLPTTLSGVAEVGALAPELASQITLTEEGLAAIRAEATEGTPSTPSPRWIERSDELWRLLCHAPMLDNDTFQVEWQEGLNTQIELRMGKDSLLISNKAAINLGDAEGLRDAAGQLVRRAGFAAPVWAVVVSRLSSQTVPTYTFDAAATTEAQNRAAEDAEGDPEYIAIPVGHQVFKRGELLTADKLELYREELKRFQSETERWRIWLRRTGLTVAVGLVTLAAGGYIAMFGGRVSRNPGRLAGITGIGLVGLALACLGSAANPAWMSVTTVAPTLLVAAIVVIGYDRRVALALSGIHGVLVSIALDQPIGTLAVILTGVGVIVWRLREVRHRATLMKAGVQTGLALGVATLTVALIERPLLPATGDAVLAQAMFDALAAAGGGLVTAGLVLAILPLIERWFDVTTGLTLIEKRDPKQPLLRQLQQRAPGTYNHSLNVASIAEAAAEAVGGDGLLTYVGALYHDIGKMNKPDYFVENAVGGSSKHDRLSPAMSLLVIVGHVKDGLALAEEAGLPRSLRHFIEAHHGTTLVEFFFSRARRLAEGRAEGEEGAGEGPAEVEYRYPGPKPRTKEVAIVMVADAVESATRTMTEPTPSRIEALVRAIANQRLTDGQFDECDLTLRELQTICESISKSVASIYHGRVQYPSTAGLVEPRAEEKRA